tara:strand:+ start:777 stop:926 length:150 start_codon:yes stop_codon:yes gene_type:complete
MRKQMNNKEKEIMQKVMDILNVHREDHVCTEEDCEECESVLAAKEILDQ